MPWRQELLIRSFTAEQRFRAAVLAAPQLSKRALVLQVELLALTLCFLQADSTVSLQTIWLDEYSQACFITGTVKLPRWLSIDPAHAYNSKLATLCEDMQSPCPQNEGQSDRPYRENGLLLVHLQQA